MGWRTCAAGLALALLVVLPVADAAILRGQVWFDAPADLGGTLRLDAPEGLLLLEDAARGGPLTLSWSSARLHAATARGTRTEGPYPTSQDDGLTPEDATLPAGALTGFSCGAGCRIVLRANGSGLVGLAGEASAPLHEADASPLVLGAGPLLATVPAWPRALVESPTAGALQGPTRAPLAAGNVTLHLGAARATLRTADGRALDEWTGLRERPVAPLVVAYESRLLALDLVDARIDVPPGAPVTLVAPRFDATLAGRLESGRADGWVEADGRHRDVEAAALRLSGDLALGLAPAPPIDGPAAQPQDAVAARQRTEFSGEGRAWVDGAPVAASPARVAAPVAAVGAAALLGLALVAALYTRVTRARVLESPVRRALFDAIRQAPGQHVAELARAHGISRVGLQHHLRMLEAHGLVVARQRGRVLAYFPPGAVPDERGVAARVALKDPTRRRVLDAAARRHDGATQADIATATGLPLRLVSYHVARLEAAGLVRGDGGRPQRFTRTG